jgi:hypothetical protein
MYLAILTVRSRSVHQEIVVSSFLCVLKSRSIIYLKVNLELPLKADWKCAEESEQRYKEYSRPNMLSTH